MKTIIFDLGGVVLNRGIWIFEDYLSKEFNTPLENIVKVMIKTHYKDYFSGEITEEEYWARCLKDLDIQTDWKALSNKLVGCFKVQKEVIETIQNLKKQGYEIGLLSDQSKEWWIKLDKKYNLSSNFDFTIVSAIEGLSKPNPKIYNLLLSKTNSNPEECLYIDDLEHNLEPAKNLGIKTLFFQNPEQLNKELTPLLK